MVFSVIKKQGRKFIIVKSKEVLQAERNSSDIIPAGGWRIFKYRITFIIMHLETIVVLQCSRDKLFTAKKISLNIKGLAILEIRILVDPFLQNN